MRDIYTNMKIPISIKKKLELMKGKDTYAAYIDKMLSYFQMAGLDPEYGQLPPALTIIKSLKSETNILYKRIEDVVKILRNIESNKIDSIMDAVMLGSLDREESSDISISEAETYKLIKKYENLQIKENEYIRQIRELKIQLDASAQNNISDENATLLIREVETLLSDKHLQRDTNGNFIISINFRDKLIEKIKTKLNV